MSGFIRFQHQQCRLFSSNNNKSKTVFVANVFPDASASAAGVRTLALLDGMAKSSSVHLVTAVSNEVSSERSSPGRQTTNSVFAAAAPPQDLMDDLARRNISWSWLPPNRSQLVKEFSKHHTDVGTILFDRYYVEEAFSFALKECYPKAARILDMQDMHSLRKVREKLVMEWDTKSDRSDDPLQVLDLVMTHVPSVDNPQLLRELGSIHRCDLTLVCSPYELQLLESTYCIASSKLCLAPFFVATDALRPISETPFGSPLFVFCGGFKHAPNVDAVRLLLRTIWPKIRAKLSTASLHIHGAYCPMEFRNAHSPNEKGIHVHGYTSSLEQIFGRPGGVLLAPLRFGAGIKGKIIDAWSHGMPVVTTPIGSEGMTSDESSEISFGGSVACSLDQFVDAAVELSTSQTAHVDAVRRGQELLRAMQNQESNWARVASTVKDVTAKLHCRRRADYTQALLWHHTARSTEYFSRWIEMKETRQA